MKKILTGIKPTGNGMHLWNYFGASKPLYDMAINEGNDVIVMLADFHTLTSVHNWETLKNNRNRLLKEFFALMPEKSNITVFEQSKITNLNNIVWILNSVTPYSMMLRAHSFKDSQNKNSEINMAVFNYPILMAADIISYDIDIVPVWKDQKQHLEFARDIAWNFNKTYNCSIFKLPEPKINEELMTIIWTDGRKMSKSYDNFIWIFDSEKIIKKKIMSIKTGCEDISDILPTQNCNVFALIKLFASQERQDEIAKKYKKPDFWYGHAKLELLEIVLNYFETARKKYNSFENNMDFIYKKLKCWNAKMNKICDEKYEKLLEIIWLR